LRGRPPQTPPKKEKRLRKKDKYFRLKQSEAAAVKDALAEGLYQENRRMRVKILT